MSIPELLRWQWSGYPRYHQNRTNLLLSCCQVAGPATSSNRSYFARPDRRFVAL